jgi:hypothetical protein
LLAAPGEAAEPEKGIAAGDTAAAAARSQANPGLPLGVALVEEGNSDSIAAVAAVGTAPDIREH